MRYVTLLLLFCGLLSTSCSNSVTGPNSGQNLLTNSTFEINGTPSLEGWIVPDTSAVHFSSDVPQGGSGSSIVMHAVWYGESGNTIFAPAPPLEGVHQYTLSVFGKDTGAGGGAYVYINRPGSPNSSLVSTLRIDSGGTWVYYSQTDTISTLSSDTLFVVIDGGGTELLSGTTYFNTCKFELLN